MSGALSPLAGPPCSPDIWEQHGLTEPIAPRNPERDWLTGNYQEQCMECKTLFWGQRDAPLCRPCAAKNESWWDSLTDEQQLEHMKRLAEGLRDIQANAASEGRRSEA